MGLHGKQWFFSVSRDPDVVFCALQIADLGGQNQTIGNNWPITAILPQDIVGRRAQNFSPKNFRPDQKSGWSQRIIVEIRVFKQKNRAFTRFSHAIPEK